MSAQSEYRGLDYSAEELQSEIEMVDQADGLVLMSDAHIRLWEERLNRKLDALPCPPIVSGNFRYSRKERERIRQEEGWVDKMVLVYCGSVSWAWQNFQSVCAIVAGLRDFADARLLVLTGEQEIAQSEIDKHGISDISTIKYVSGDEVPSYLSAADTGFFLRDDHLMCRIVTSAKLGEYLACGLPVISTDIASLYPEFSIRNGFSIRIDPESKEMTPDSIAKLNDLVACHQKNDSDRQRVSDLFHEEFSDQKIGDSYASYVSKLVRESNEQT
jgi:glycosyltransferase involved in cell wall biosynthesis